MKQQSQLQQLFLTGVLFLTLGFGWMLFGCSHESDSFPFRWRKINSKADTLTQHLDRMFYTHAPQNQIKLRLDSLEVINKKTGGNEELSNRIDFFKLLFLSSTGEEEKFEKGVEDMLAKVDSASNPYLYNRLLNIVPDSERRDVDKYERINGLVEYFRDKGDPLLTASCLVDLGNLLKNVRDPASAISVYEEADSLFRAYGMDKLASFNRMNIATASIILRDTVKGVAILEEMRKDPVIMADSGMYADVLHNLYIDGRVRDALDSLYSIKGENSESLIETFMSNALLNDGDVAGAVKHAQLAIDKALEDESANDYAVALYAHADAVSASGDTVKAYRSLIEAVELTDEISNANEPEAIKDVETDRILSMRRLEAELAKSRWQLRLVCIGFGFLIVLTLSAWLIRKRIKKLHQRSEQMSKEKDKIARKLVATQIAMDETDRVLDSVGKAVVDLNEGNGSSDCSREIANAIHTHKVRSTERETFIDSFSSVNPDFARRLKEKNSAITELDVRLASYIVTGMDNKMIASTMRIRPESVKQARWRLRSKLSLAKGASLEEALRELNQKE